jgi:hypothetical protein
LNYVRCEVVGEVERGQVFVVGPIPLHRLGGGSAPFDDPVSDRPLELVISEESCRVLILIGLGEVEAGSYGDEIGLDI